MSNLRIHIFDVYHGLCALLVTPTGYGVMIDCGRSKNFSPVRYAAEKLDLTAWNGYPLAQLVVSHPHDDHIEDISNLRSMLQPGLLSRESDYDWNEIKQTDNADDHANLNEYVDFQSSYNKTPSALPDFGGVTVDVGPCISPADAIGLGSTVNNSSTPVFVEYEGVRFCFPGDLEVAGWQRLLEERIFRERLRGCHFFVASHHGHESGYCADAFDAMGEDPYLNIVSIKHDDTSICSAYSTRAKGWTVSGQTRKMLTTRSDGTIIIDVSPGAKVGVRTEMLGANEW